MLERLAVSAEAWLDNIDPWRDLAKLNLNDVLITDFRGGEHLLFVGHKAHTRFSGFVE
jgi:hypothetical protein